MATLLNTADQIQQAKLDRRRKLAESFAMGSLQQDPTQVVSGIAVKQGPLSAISKLAQAFVSTRLDKQADTEGTALAKARDERARTAWANLAGGSTPAPSPGGITSPVPRGPQPTPASQPGDVTTKPYVDPMNPQQEQLQPGEYIAREDDTNPQAAPVTIPGNKLNAPPARKTREDLLQQALALSESTGSPVETILGTPWFKQQFDSIENADKEQQKRTPIEQNYDALDRAHRAGDSQKAATIQAAIDSEKAPKVTMIPGPDNTETPNAWDPKLGRFAPIEGASARPIFNPNPLVAVNTAQETEESKTVGKGYGERFLQIQDSALASQRKASRMDRLSALLEGVNTGKLTPIGTEIAAFAKSMGFDIDSKLGNKQAADALSNEMALELRSPSGGAGMPGAMSDQDREHLKSMVPGLSKTPEGRALIVQTYHLLAKRDADVARLARGYRKQHGALDEGFYDELETFSAQNPLFKGAPDPSKFTGAPSGGTTSDGWTIEEVQ